MAFKTTFETRHVDTYAATPFVHGGVLLAFTEMTYARLEGHLGLSKPPHIVCVERETRALYHAPLHWRDGAEIEVTTTEIDRKGFTQEFAIRSVASGAKVATIVHRWTWLDTVSGQRVELDDEAIERLGSV